MQGIARERQSIDEVMGKAPLGQESVGRLQNTDHLLNTDPLSLHPHFPWIGAAANISSGTGIPGPINRQERNPDAGHDSRIDKLHQPGKICNEASRALDSRILQKIVYARRFLVDIHERTDGRSQSCESA
jgi:hypothetical protein